MELQVWNSTCGIAVKCAFILPHIPHANLPHMEFQHRCVGGPVESMYGHSMECNSSSGDGILLVELTILWHFFLSIPYIQQIMVLLQGILAMLR